MGGPPAPPPVGVGWVVRVVSEWIVKSCPLYICGEILISKRIFNDEAMLRKP